MEFSLIHVFDDPSDGLINNRLFNGSFLIVDQTKLTEKQKKEVFDLLVLLCMKMSSLWNIQQCYLEKLEQVKLEVKNSEQRENTAYFAAQSTDLMGWADVFLVQIKSTLDHLVKIPSPVFGYNRWSLASFGNRGEKVRRGFVSLPREYHKRTSNYYKSIFEDQEWIDDVIELRDRLNHGVKGGGDPKMFSVSYNQDTDTYRVPMWSDQQTMQDAMAVIFNDLLTTCCLFNGMIFAVKLPEHLTVVCDTKNTFGKEPLCKVVSMKDLENTIQHTGKSSVRLPDE